MLPPLLFISVKDITRLDRDLYKQRTKRNVEEALWRRDAYSADLWCCFTFRYNLGQVEAEKAIRHHLVKVSRKIKRHIFWWGRFDNQPTRGSDGKSYIHFHLFLEIEKRDGDVKHLINGIAKVEIKRWRGDVDIRDYNPLKNGVEYTINKHRGSVEDIACPRCVRKCNTNGRVCFYKKDALAFVNRNRFTRH